MDTENTQYGTFNAERTRKALEIFGRTPASQYSTELCDMLGECLGTTLAEADKLRAWVTEADRRGDEAMGRAHAAEAEVERLKAELQKASRRDAMLCNTVERGYLAMQAAWLEAEITSPANGMVWIHNTLCGPGLLPDLDEARALGGAQAWFDRESAKLDKVDADREAKATGASHG